MMMSIPMVNLQRQYCRLRGEIDQAIAEVLHKATFIGGEEVGTLSKALASRLGSKEVVTCANGTDALQIAFMTLGLTAGDEVIVPSFTYVASAEAAALLGLIPRFVDVDCDTFCICPDAVEKAITPKTKAILPVHLFGQSAPMEAILDIAHRYGLAVIEDNAQAIDCLYSFADGRAMKTGTIGDIGCTSFFPSKNLGCYGDGGALSFGNVSTLAGESELSALKARRIANHGQETKYLHQEIGCNSRLDTLQAAILLVKLRHLGESTRRRQQVAALYNEILSSVPAVSIPQRASYSSHVFHQYTIRVEGERREALVHFLAEHGIASGVYYPRPLHQQPAFKVFHQGREALPTSERLASEVLSLPICPEISDDEVARVGEAVTTFFKL